MQLQLNNVKIGRDISADFSFANFWVLNVNIDA